MMVLRKINSDAATKLDMDIARDGFLPGMPIAGFSHGLPGTKTETHRHRSIKASFLNLKRGMPVVLWL